MNKKTLIINIILSFVCIFSFPVVSLATLGEEPFGGMSFRVEYCNCSNNYLIFHTAVTGKSILLFQDGRSKEYEYGNIKKSGNWILGNYSSNVACDKMTSDGCKNFGYFPLITMVGTSDPFKLAGSGVYGDDGRDTTPPPSEGRETNQTNPNTGNGGTSGTDGSGGIGTSPTGRANETPADAGRSEAEVRSELASNGVQVAPDLSPTLSPVSKLPNNAIAGVEDLAQDCGPECNVMITSGARQPGNAVAPGEHGTGKPVFDLNKDPGLDKHIADTSVRNYTTGAGRTYVMANGDEYLDENFANTGGTGSHWHVRIKGRHM